MSKRINIFIPEPILNIIDKAAKKFYDGNRSRFLSDAGSKYANDLEKEKRKGDKQ